MTVKIKVTYGILILVGALLFGVLVWPTQYRYDKLKLGDNTYPVRMNRITGSTEIFTPSGWSKRDKVGTSEPESVLIELSQNELSQLSGRCEFTYLGYLECDIYNGSEKTLREILVEVIVEPAGGSSFTRKYRLSPRYPSSEAPPLRSTTFNVDAGLEPSGEEWSWKIVSAKGYSQ